MDHTQTDIYHVMEHCRWT